MADEVGSIALKLRLDGSDLTGQFEKISQDMQKQMQDPLDRVNRNISNAFDKPMENARKSVEAQTAAIKKEFSSLSEDAAKRGLCGDSGLSEIQGCKNAGAGNAENRSFGGLSGFVRSAGAVKAEAGKHRLADRCGAAEAGGA